MTADINNEKSHKGLPKKLPSNRSFVIFFVIILTGCAIYFYLLPMLFVSLAFLSLALILIVLFWTNSNAVFFLNNLWFRIGQILGLVVSPLIMAVIFFLVFAPIGVCMRIIGRDELEISPVKKTTYWKTKTESGSIGSSFKQQF